MKKINIIIAVGCAALIMQACHNGTTTTTTTDSTAIKTDATKTDSAKTTAAPDTGDAKFVTAAATGGMTEIALSKAALQQSQDAKVKEFATMMVSDHTAAGNKLMAIAKAENINAPTAPDTAQQNAVAMLSKKSGKEFDMAYINKMVIDHKKTIALFDSAKTAVKDTSLKTFITTTLPTLHKHLDAITKLKAECTKMKM